MINKILAFSIILFYIFSSTLNVSAQTMLSEQEKHQIQQLKAEIYQIKKAKLQWDHSFSGNIYTEEGAKAYWEGMGTFEKQISDKANEILDIEGKTYAVIPGTRIPVSTKWLKQWNNEVTEFSTEKMQMKNVLLLLKGQILYGFCQWYKPLPYNNEFCKSHETFLLYK